MNEEPRGTPLYKIVAFAVAGLIVLLAVALFVMYGPGLGTKTPTARLTEAFAEHFPGSDPVVARPRPDTLEFSLTVRFDPTVDAEQAHHTFRRAAEIAEAQGIEGVREVEIELRGTSLEGGVTAASRTFEYEAGE
ncbi:MAG: hypothetical protein FJX74_14015 [Armatimonadetes bacterium]|nr:hypothetical protein [Armatimonadota bacterium]